MKHPRIAFLAAIVVMVVAGLWLGGGVGRNPPPAPASGHAAPATTAPPPLPAPAVRSPAVSAQSQPSVSTSAPLVTSPMSSAGSALTVTAAPKPMPAAPPPASQVKVQARATPPRGADDQATLDAAAIDLEKVNLMLRDYRTLMGGNPVGTNAEIMKAVMGGNPKHAQLGPPEGLHVNSNGELIDRWGTPFFFHQMSARDMQIRSAGPDRIMWTGDDVITR